MRFYKLEAIGGHFSDYYANALSAEDKPFITGEPRVACPVCGEGLTMLRWLPPHYVELIDFKRFGDYVADPGSDGFFSERFLDAFERDRLTGIEVIHPAAEIVRIRGRGKLRAEPPPKYHLVEVARNGADVDDDASGVVRETVDCPRCRSGNLTSYDRIVFEPGTWNGLDIFCAYGIFNTVLVSQRFVDFCFRHEITNVSFMPGEYACQSYGLGAKPDRSRAIVSVPPPRPRRARKSST